MDRTFVNQRYIGDTLFRAWRSSTTPGLSYVERDGIFKEADLRKVWRDDKILVELFGEGA